MNSIEIRRTTAGDIDALARVIDATGLFPSDMLPDLLRPAVQGESDAIWLTGLEDGAPVGFCYAEPEQLSDRVWNMLALGVAPACQGRGLGQRLVRLLEDDLRAQGQRLLIVDTSGTDAFAATRAFYERCGYAQEARIRDYWSEGDDKVTFRKILSQG